jgi:Zn-dependent protease with chaperone function
MKETKMRRPSHRGLAAGLVALVLAAGAVHAQTKIKQGFNLFSVDQDVEIGRQSAAKVEQQLPIINDATSTNYVRAIGQRLAAAMPGTRFNYQFKIVNASDVNAFALPGGFMYVNRGLIEAAKNEGQLAGVLAHEMAHVALRHGTNQASKAYMSQTGLGILGSFLGKGDSNSTSKVIGTVGGFGLNALFLKFSRTDEEQADVYGAQTMAKAGYNPQDMIDFFDTLASLQSRNPSKVEQFFSSHPAPANRAARIRNEMKYLTVQTAAPVGSLARAKSALATQPAARTTQQIAQGGTSAPTRTYPENGSIGQIEAPADTFRSFTSDQGLYRIEYPSNWTVNEAGDGLGVTIAPQGGFVQAGGPTDDLVYGVIVNHYAPFGSDDEDNGRFNFQASPGSGGDVSRTTLATATNDLVSEIMRNNRSLRIVADSQRSDVIDGAKALSLVLTGQSQVTGQEERVTVFTRELPDDHVIYALFIAPGRDYAALRPTFNRMISSLRVDDSARH